MEIDLNQLPIPDWGLVCPSCGYALRGLPSHRCPECGLQFDLPTILPTYARVREPRFTGRELPVPDFGLDCPECGAKLAGARSRVCPVCGELFDPAEFVPIREWFPVRFENPDEGEPQALAAILDEHYIPYLLDDRNSAFRSWSSLRVSREFFFDYLWLVQRAVRLRLPAAETIPDWQCPGCSEENPATFEVCWSCGGMRPG